MGIISKLTTKFKEQDTKKRAYQFVRIFGSVVDILGLYNERMEKEHTQQIIREIGTLDNSSDVFIKMVLYIHSMEEEYGLYILKNIGRLYKGGADYKTMMDRMDLEDVGHVYDLIEKALPGIKKIIIDTNENIVKEPVLLLFGFRSYIVKMGKRLEDGGIVNPNSKPRCLKQNGISPKIDIRVNDLT